MTSKSKFLLLFLFSSLIVLFTAKMLIIELGLPGKEYFAKRIALKYSPIRKLTSAHLKYVDIEDYPFHKQGIIYSPVFYVVDRTDKFDREITVYVNNIDMRIHYIEYK